MGFVDFINEKGVRALSVVFEVSEDTVYSWKKRGRIPRSRWDTIMEHWPKLTWSRLLAWEREARGRKPLGAEIVTHQAA